jgi:hypothetical protein
MYSLVEKYIKIHEKEQGMKDLLKSTDWTFINDEDSSVIKDEHSKNEKVYIYETVEEERPSLSNHLFFSEPPEPVERRGSDTRRFQGRQVDFAENTSRNKALGLCEEKLVIRWERESLIEAWRPDLAKRVKHTSVIEGDGEGYDVLSFTLGGMPKYIEVKTTTDGERTPFIMTINELALEEAQKYIIHCRN